MDENKIVLVYVFLEVCLAGLNIFGNSIICYVMIFKKKLSKSSDHFMLSVAVSDLLIAFLASPLVMIRVKLPTSSWQTSTYKVLFST